METAEMRRSTLQRKDREELTLIATTLGRKPSSRARKGEIIDLILDLAAGGDGSAAVEADGDAPQSADDAVAPAEDAAASDADASTPDDDAATADEDDASDRPAPARSRSPRAKSTRSNGGGSSDDDSDSTGSESTGSESTGSDSTGSENSGSDDESSDANGDRNNDGSDSGNRKRRRRGRDREANKDSNEGWDGEPIPVAGLLELRPEGYGFLRVDGALPSRDDAYVPVKMVRQFGLRKGDHLAGTSRPANRNEKNPAMMEIQSVNDGDPEAVIGRVEFDALPAVYPDEPIVLAGKKKAADPTARVIDLLTPIGKGQRALLAAGPRTGKTTVLQRVIESIEANHADLELLVLLLDERPEDITEMTRLVERGDVVASTFERPSDEQVTIAEMVIERAKRLVESGKDVVVIVDGITRLARAYAQEAAGARSGVVIDAMSVFPAKRFLGAARNLEGGGSLTMIATIAVDSDSEADKLIYEELAGTANLELRLDRAAAIRRVFPAVDVQASSTVHDEKLRAPKKNDEIRDLRRELAAIADDPTAEASADLQALLAKIAAE